MDSKEKIRNCPETALNFDENATDPLFQNEFKLSDVLQEQLRENYPDVLELINALRAFIEKQQKKVRKLKMKLKKQKVTKDVGIQTEELTDVADLTKTLSEEITEAAEMAMQKTGFVYEETSGLYYDYNSGYYYNAELGLYYDGNTGTYMTYNAETQSYDFHSQVDVIPNVLSNTTRSTQEGNHKRSKRKKNNRNNSKGCKRERGAAGYKENSDLEEGECSDSSHTDTSEDNSDDTNHSDHTDIAKAWPPCMRIIVKGTAVPKLKEGSLYIITYEGGSLGREGDHALLIPDINISKHHLKFAFNKDTGQYLIIDLGSRNGTLLNGKRISASKQESDPIEVTHGSQVQIGSTVLLCHIHSGNETCGHCEPGLLQIKQDITEETLKLNKNEQHKKELRKLRKKFGINSSEASSTQLAAGYTDRAQVRRQTVGSQNEHEKTQVASLDQSIGSENKGFKLLSKMGWSKGQSLGKEGTGVLNPVELVSATGTTGMGYTGGSSSKSIQPVQTKQNIWEKTQKRYEQLPSSVPTSPADVE